MRRVLVVDDTLAARRSYVRVLQQFGLAAESAASGFEALTLLKLDQTFDLVLVDQFMPGFTGLDVIQRSPEQTRKRMVLITATLQADLSLEAHRRGVLVLQKPVRPELVTYLIEEMSRAEPANTSVGDAPALALQCCERFASRFRLTGRQREVLRALVTGKTSRVEIADELVCSLKTLDSHMQAIFSKTGMRSQLELALALLNLACDRQRIEGAEQALRL